MTPGRTITEQLALSILAREGVAAIWQLYVALRTLIARSTLWRRNRFWSSPTPRRQLGCASKESAS